MTSSAPRALEFGPASKSDRANRPVRADARRNREKIVAAARQLFTGSTPVVSMDDIARSAGVAPATLARNFASRSDLVEAVYQQEVARLSSLAEEGRNAPDAWVALTAWLHAFLEVSRLTSVMFGTSGRAVDRSKLDARTRQIEAAFGNLLERAQDAGFVKAELSRHDVVQLVGGLVFSLAADTARSEDLFDVVLDGIRA